MADGINLERGIAGAALGGIAGLVAAPLKGLFAAGYGAARAVSGYISNPEKPLLDTAVEFAYDTASAYLGGTVTDIIF